MSKKIEPTTTYTASKVRKVTTKKGTALQFTLTVTFDRGCTIYARNCIMGIGKNGVWCTAPLMKYRPVGFNKVLTDKLIEGFQKMGALADLSQPEWNEEDETTVEFTT